MAFHLLEASVPPVCYSLIPCENPADFLIGDRAREIHSGEVSQSEASCEIPKAGMDGLHGPARFP